MFRGKKRRVLLRTLRFVCFKNEPSQEPDLPERNYIGVVATNDTVFGVWCDTREGSETDGDSEIYTVGVLYHLVPEVR